MKKILASIYFVYVAILFFLCLTCMLIIYVPLLLIRNDRTRMKIIYWLHKELLAPFMGAPYLGALGLGLLALLAAGLVYWWPKSGQFKRAFRVQIGRGPRRLFHDVHAAGGAAGGVLLLVSAATGVFMCYEVKIEGVLSRLGLATSPPVSPVLWDSAG